MARLNISNAHKEVLAELYKQTRLTVDRLPYTDEFEKLYTAFVERTGRALTRNEVWRALASVRKRSGLVRKER
ncbi:MAG: hypothetical protein KKB50_02115 [Planctomycetes bacterium]|nr:hypothetical protein [Planctomycetota bacterium]